MAATDPTVSACWASCTAAKARLEAALAPASGAGPSPHDLASGLLSDLWREVSAFAAAQDDRYARTAETLRLARNECVSLQRIAREANDKAVAMLQQAAGTAAELRVARDDSQAAFARQMELRGAEEAHWKAEYAAQMQSVVTNTVRHAREAAQLQHTAALEAALAQVATTYKAQLSAADASLAELQFHLAGAVQARDGAAARLAGALAERDGAMAEARDLRSELAAAQSALRELSSRHRELRAELRYRDSAAALSRHIDHSMEKLSLARHGLRAEAESGVRGGGRESGHGGPGARSDASRVSGVDESAGARAGGRRVDGGGSLGAGSRRRHVSYEDERAPGLASREE